MRYLILFFILLGCANKQSTKGKIIDEEILSYSLYSLHAHQPYASDFITEFRGQGIEDKTIHNILLEIEESQERINVMIESSLMGQE